MPTPPDGIPVAILVTGTLDRTYRSRDRLGPTELVTVRTLDGTLIPVPPDRAGVYLLPPHARETLRQALADALEFHSEGTNAECECLTVRYEALRDALGLGVR
jgi:hypothetical protein